MKIIKLNEDNVDLMNSLLQVFGEAFDDIPRYTHNRPTEQYLKDLLRGESFIALVAMSEDVVCGGIAAYDLKKFEQSRSEIYIYDLAVALQYRRQGVATTLIQSLKDIARTRGADVIFVQADTDIEDEPAIALYKKLGTMAEVLHFDIAVSPET